MAYSELPWRPFLGHLAWSWTTLRRVTFFITFTNVFKKNCVTFFYVLTFFKFLFERFLHLWFTLRSKTAIQDVNSAFSPDHSVLNFGSTATPSKCRRPTPSLVRYGIRIVLWGIKRDVQNVSQSTVLRRTRLCCPANVCLFISCGCSER